MRVIKNMLPVFLLIDSVAACTTTAVLLHTTKPARHEPAGLIMFVIYMRTKSMKTFDLRNSLSTRWYFARSQECSYSWSQNVIPLAQQDHSVRFPPSKENKFVHISPFLVFQISSDPYWQMLHCNKGIVFSASLSLPCNCLPVSPLPFWTRLLARLLICPFESDLQRSLHASW